MFEMAILLGSAVGKSFFESEEGKAQERALELKRKEEELQATQEAVLRDEQLEKVLASQRAEGAARGITPTSASLSAISTGTFNNFAEDVQARNLNLQMKEANIDTAEENIKRKVMYDTFGNLFDAANRFNNLRVPQAPKLMSGKELDTATKQTNDFKIAGPLDLKKHNQEEINFNIGF
jgi:hypothetical protein